MLTSYNFSLSSVTWKEVDLIYFNKLLNALIFPTLCGADAKEFTCSFFIFDVFY